MNTTTVVEEIQRIKNNIENAYTSLEEIGATLPEERNSDNLQIVIKEVPVGGGDPPEKGIDIKGWDSEGYPTSIEVVGLTTLPDYYLYMAYRTFLKKATIKLPSNMTSIGTYNFYYSNLVDLKIPDSVTYLGNYCFAYSTGLLNLKLPSKLKSVGEYCFGYSAIEKLDFPSGVTALPNNTCNSWGGNTAIMRGAVTSIGTRGFYNAYNLKTLILPNVTKVPQIQSDTFDRCPIKNGSGYTYVPDSLVDSFKSYTNWSSFGSRIKPISELPDAYKEIL